MRLSDVMLILFLFLIYWTLNCLPKAFNFQQQACPDWEVIIWDNLNVSVISDQTITFITY